MQILIFGDSLTYGAWDNQGGWAQRLRRFVEEKYPEQHFVYNLGIPGDTTKYIVERFELEAKQRIFDEEETVIIFQVGANDSGIRTSKGNSEWVSPREFERNIRKLIFGARKITEKVFFVTDVPIDEKKTCPVPWDKDISYTNKNIIRYCEIIKEICEKEKIGFIDVFDIFKKQNIGDLLKDGVHPTSSGHQLIFQIVKDFLEKNKVI